MKTITMCVSLFFLLLVSPVLAQSGNRLSVSGPLPPEVVAARQQSDLLVDQGEAFLKANSYKAAEQTFREAMTVATAGSDGISTSAERGLAESLAAEGKTEEAAMVYRTLIYTYPRNFSSDAQDVRTQMRFASLLSQTGHWPEAVSVYEKALPNVVLGGMPKLKIHFDPRMPMPIQLQAMAHVACGIHAIAQNDCIAALQEFEQGSLLAPDSALANFYCGFSWGQINLRSPVWKAKEAFAKAALQKAFASGDNDTKKATEEAMAILNMNMKKLK